MSKLIKLLRSQESELLACDQSFFEYLRAMKPTRLVYKSPCR